ncbi:hypothetical protein BDP27DRAFT_1434227 [Rhodocollybia butyracea]|uniref:Uncharacterized protein n=1 Tax=Rhodocollybia butyracea TaxID=206335 RepID=A0A9P5P3R6_9AGAR|nr:hypothetical protein BDP27DRAFT_1434227 [Rhodocollybia butyracea]
MSAIEPPTFIYHIVTNDPERGLFQGYLQYRVQQLRIQPICKSWFNWAELRSLCYQRVSPVSTIERFRTHFHMPAICRPSLMNSFSLKQLTAITALPDDQRIALAQEKTFTAVPAYLEPSFASTQGHSKMNNQVTHGVLERPFILASASQSVRASTLGSDSSASAPHVSFTSEIELAKEKGKAPPPFISCEHVRSVLRSIRDNDPYAGSSATKSTAWAKVFETFVKAGGVKDTRAQTLKDKVKELLDCHEGAQRKTPITLAMHAVASMRRRSADEMASASVVRREKEKKKTIDGKFIAQASLTTMARKALDEKAELINLSSDSENDPVKEDESDIEMEVTQHNDAPNNSVIDEKTNVKKENKSPKAKAPKSKKKHMTNSHVRKCSRRDDNNILSDMKTSMAETQKLHERIVDNIEASNHKTEVFQDKFLDLFECMVNK